MEATALNLHDNPFAVKTPEDMTAGDAVDLFVNVFSDFPKVPLQGHLFVNGPRGSGKSMMFRYLQPDCQCLVYKCAIGALPFFSIYVGIKNTELKLTELERLEDKHGSTVLNEHFMTVAFARIALASLEKQCPKLTDASSLDEVKAFAKDTFFSLLIDCGLPSKDVILLDDITSTQDGFRRMGQACSELFKRILGYIKRLAFQTDAVPYDGPLCGYLDFLYPVLSGLKRLSFMPKGSIFLLIDDADNLSLAQTRILNSWVASRTSSNVSIKISTQHQYKTYQTTIRNTIDAPHDFSEVDISTLYTSRKSIYRARLHEIVLKRLKKGDITVSPEEFFPTDVKQEKEIGAIGEEYRRNWEKGGRGYRASDDATRYARPDYIRSLGGSRKSGHSYSYSGFDQLVHISSGIVRYFLEAASDMYSEAKAKADSKPIAFIPTGIQDAVVRRQADDMVLHHFDKMRADQSPDAVPKDLVESLSNLIRALGGIFYEILVSDRSERRVFSVAFSDEPNAEIRGVLTLGEQLGYFHVSAIGNKDGTGRTPLYVLSRRVAPHFKLDPTSFAGYLFVTNDQMLKAMQNPNSLLRRVKKEGIDSTFDTSQLRLFEEA